MITEIPQRITCRFSTKSEIPSDHAAPGAREPRASPRMPLTVTTHHLSHGDTAETWGRQPPLAMRPAVVKRRYRGALGRG